MKVSMMAHLVETGEMEKLKELLRFRLEESGWRDEMKALCKAEVEKKGANNVTVDELVLAITEEGRKKVDADVKKELLHEIRKFFRREENSTQ